MNLLIASTVASSAIIACGPALAQPPVFSDLSLKEARARAGDRIVLVDATAEWCPPCKMMDRTTWVDDRLVEWIGQNAIAVQVDVDHEPETARELGIRAMPTMIAYKNGEEFGRAVGYRDAEQMLEWLEEVRQAEAPQDVPRAAEAGGRPSGEVDERLARAREALEGGEHERATEDLLWLWKNIPEEAPEMNAVRTSFLAGDIARLVEQHEPARRSFEEIRDQTEARLREDPTWHDLTDWLALNARILRDHDAIIAWADRIKGDEAGVTTLRRVGHHVAEIFEQRRRIDLTGLLHTSPMIQVEQMWRKVEMVESPEGAGIFAMMDPMYDVEGMEPGDFEDPEFREDVRSTARQRFMQESTALYASLLAAGRHQEASRIGAFIRDKAPSPLAEIELVGAAVEHSLAQRDHLAWLDEASPENEDDARHLEHLRRRVREQLEAGPGDEARQERGPDR